MKFVQKIIYFLVFEYTNSSFVISGWTLLWKFLWNTHFLWVCSWHFCREHRCWCMTTALSLECHTGRPSHPTSTPLLSTLCPLSSHSSCRIGINFTSQTRPSWKWCEEKFGLFPQSLVKCSGKLLLIRSQFCMKKLKIKQKVIVIWFQILLRKAW